MAKVSTGASVREGGEGRISGARRGHYCTPADTSGEAASPPSPGIKVAGPEGAGGGEMGVLSVSPTGTYYIYAFDGRLLAEYNGLSICVRDYITMGGKLIAAYCPEAFTRRGTGASGIRGE